MQRILVVEDDFDIQELLQNFLQEAGYEVAVANDGVEALSLFAGQRYDLIVLDIMLPKIDGYGVCELIRKQSDVPIIMLTALSGEEDQIKGLDLQVDDYITKPFSMPVLLRKIAAVLRRSNRETDEKYQIITYGNLLLNCDSYEHFPRINGEAARTHLLHFTLDHCPFLGSHRNAQHDIPRSVCHLFTVLSAPNKGLGLSQQAKHKQVLFRECGYTPYACYGISLTTTTAAQPQFGKPQANFFKRKTP